MSDEFMLKTQRLPTEYDQIMRQFEIREDGGFIFTDQAVLNRQKGVLSHVVKEVALTILKGLSISHVSLPIKIFEPRSTLERIVDLWSFATLYLKKAG